jgi:hypothetical protein
LTVSLRFVAVTHISEANGSNRCIAAGELANLIQQMHQGSRFDLIGHDLSGQVWISTAKAN